MKMQTFRRWQHAQHRAATIGVMVIALLLLGTAILLTRPVQGQDTAIAAPAAPDAPVSPSFTYQGRLTDGGAPANGAYDLRMRLFDAASGGTPVSSNWLFADVTVSAGYFTVVLNFADYFQGEARWLEVEVRPGASTGSYTLLTPRTRLTAVPYALGLMPGATVNTTANVPALSLNTTTANVPALRLNAPNANSNALVATGNGDGYAVIYAEDLSEYGGYGLYVKSNAIHGYGLYAKASNGVGVRGEGYNVGVLGDAHPIAGTGVTGVGLYGVRGSNGGSNSSGYAGSFNGRVEVVGTLSKGGGSFKIDHPLDPVNKTLSHSFVESPDMMNIYNGNVTTDEAGFATVILPDWFEALNRDFRYQLTVIGQFAQVMVAEEVQDNQFRIQTDRPGVKVSWQVTGIRHDPFAEANRIQVEEMKTGAERGRYLYPDVYNESVREGIWYASSPNIRHMIDHPEARERLDEFTVPTIDAPPTADVTDQPGVADPEGARP
jgi:hypothetical protein